MRTMYTVGYGGRSPQDFIALLTQHAIQLICDVRAEPRRAYRGIYTYNPEKRRGPLARMLAEAGIAYQWFPELGNPQRTDPEMQAFQRLMACEAETRLRRLRVSAQTAQVCLLCAEQNAAHCHRSLITSYLEAYGYDVHHI